MFGILIILAFAATGLLGAVAFEMFPARQGVGRAVVRVPAVSPLRRRQL